MDANRRKLSLTQEAKLMTCPKCRKANPEVLRGSHVTELCRCGDEVKQGMKTVILESPYAGDIERNTEYARKCVRDSLLRGEAPLASHLLYTQPGILREEIPEERHHGIDAGHAWLRFAWLMAVYTDYGISKGMKAAMERAQELHIEIEERKILAHG